MNILNNRPLFFILEGRFYFLRPNESTLFSKEEEQLILKVKFNFMCLVIVAIIMITLGCLCNSHWRLTLNLAACAFCGLTYFCKSTSGLSNSFY